MTRRRHVCPAAGCGRSLQSWERLCGRCWRLLPADFAQAIIGARAVRDALAISAATRAAVTWLAEHSPAAAAARMLGESLDFARDERDPP